MPVGEEEDKGPTAARVTIVNGRVIYDQSSLQVTSQDANVPEGFFHDVEETENMVNSASFSKRKHSEPWSATETDAFYVVCQGCKS